MYQLLKKGLAGGMVAVLLISCSPVKVYTEKSDIIGSREYRTFAILNEVQGKAAFNSPILEERLQNKLILEMENRGYVYDKDSPDLIIRYNTDITKNQRVIYPNPYTMMWNPFWGPMGGRGMQAQKYDQGEVVFDFIDPAADKVILRATAVGTVNNPNDKEKKIQAAVNKVMKEFSSKIAQG